MKIRPVGEELFHADGRDEANSLFGNFADALNTVILRTKILRI